MVNRGYVIRGWDQIIPYLSLGERVNVTIPSELAYGTAGTTGIPPNTDLKFDIELVSINNHDAEDH